MLDKNIIFVAKSSAIGINNTTNKNLREIQLTFLNFFAKPNIGNIINNMIYIMSNGIVNDSPQYRYHGTPHIYITNDTI